MEEEEYILCDHCGHEFPESELLEDDYSQYKGFSDEFLCPECKNVIE